MAAFELTKDYLDSIVEAIETGNVGYLTSELEEHRPADIAAILYEVNGEQAHYLLQLLDTEEGAEVLSNIEKEDLKKFIKEQFTVDEIATYVNLFDSDDAVDLLNQLSIGFREKIIALLEDREQARFIIDLMHYPEDVAGGLMQKELVKVFLGQTVSECVEVIREQAENVDKVYAVYVVDDNHILKGIVSLKQIVLARKNTRIENIFDENIVYVDTTKSGDEVAEIMQRYDLEAIPVVIDFITEKAEEDIQKMAGITGEVEEDDSVWKLAKSRIPWLVIGVFGSLMAATVIGQFDEVLSKIGALSMFIPLMGSTGGNVGIQTSSLIVQSLSEKSGIEIGIWQRLSKVGKVALINGLVVGVVAGAYVFVTGHSNLFWVVFLSLMSVVILASLMGTLTPLILDKFGVNPAIASGPFITTANDLVGIGTYFLVAYYLLDLA
jgi:magnesium transporter